MVSDSFPLSEYQLGTWYAHLLEPQSPAFTVAPICARIRGVDVGAFRKAIDAFLERHPAWRVSVHGFGTEATQRVERHFEVPFFERDLRGATDDEIALVVRDDYRRPFDFSKGTVELFLYRSDGDPVLFFKGHHLTQDLVSTDILYAELPHDYEAVLDGRSAALPPEEGSYEEFVAWHRAKLDSEEGARQLAHWRAVLAGSTSALELPIDFQRPAVRHSDAGGTYSFEIDSRTIAGLSTLQPNLFRALMAAYQVFLHRYTLQHDFLVGTPANGRTAPRFNETVGNFVNMLALRTQVDGDLTFRQFMEQSARVVSAAGKNREVPLVRLVEHAGGRREASQAPMFSTSFAFNVNARVKSLSAFMIRDARCRSRFGRHEMETFPLAVLEGQYDLSMWGAPVDDRIVMELKFNRDLFAEQTVERLAAGFKTLLSGVVEHPDTRIRDVTAIDERQREALRVFATGAALRSERPAIHEGILARARSTPDSIAVEFGDQSLSYGELDAASERLARALSRRGVGRGAVVGVLLERSIELVIALLGTLRAGAAYLPIDPTYPAERIRFMLAHSRCAVLLSRQPDLGGGTPSLAIDRALHEPSVGAEALPRVADEDAAYIIYTSGSTGTPKGAVLSHAAIANHMAWMTEQFGFASSERVLQKTPISFDASVWEFWAPLLVGGTLVMAPPDAHRDTHVLVETVIERGITALQLVPSIFNVFADEESLSSCGSLRWLFCGGEALSIASVRRFRRRLGRDTCRVVNLYGPTETCIDSLAFDCSNAEGEGIAPIGAPIADTRLAVLDRAGVPVPLGVAGELAIGGAGVGLGYRHEPALTAERFVPDPGAHGRRMYLSGDRVRFASDGNVHFLGRADHQVKLRGYRIELGEIESRLREHSRVRDVVVVVHTDDAGAKLLVAYLVDGLLDGADDPSNASALTAELRAHLAGRLPDYMIPSHFIFLASLPLLPNGKCDRRALPSPRAEKRRVDPPTTETEKTLCRIWTDVLATDEVGVTDNFFDLGGDSIIAIRIVGRARSAGIALSISDFMRSPTIRELAAGAHAVSSADEKPPMAPFSLLAPSDRERLPSDVVDAYPATALQLYMLEQDRLHPTESLYHVASTYDVKLPYDEGALRAAVVNVATRHASLATSFADAGYTTPLQLVHRTPVVHIDRCDGDSADDETAILMELVRVPYSAVGPIPLHVRARVRGERSFRLDLATHHAIIDGWSSTMLVREIIAAYASSLGEAHEPLPSAPIIQYREHVELERRARTESKSFWDSELAGYRPPDRPRTPASEPTQAPFVVVDVPPAVQSGLLRVAESLKVPQKSVLLAAHLAAIATIDDVTDVVTAVLANARPELPDADRAVGLFWNPVPHRQSVAKGSFRDLVREAYSQEQRWLPHRHHPFSRLHADPPSLHGFGGDEYAAFAFNYLHFHGLSDLKSSLGGHRAFSPMSFGIVANYSRDVLSGRSLSVILSGRSTRVSQQRVAAFAEVLLFLLERLAVDPTHAVAAAIDEARPLGRRR